MSQNFEIMKVFDHRNLGQFIFARQINAGQNFELKEGSMLGSVTLFQYLDIPRILDKNGKQRLDVFVFRPLSCFSSDSFEEGQVVELIIPD